MKQYICSVCHHVGRAKTRMSGKRFCASCGEGPVLPVTSPRGRELLATSGQVGGEVSPSINATSPDTGFAKAFIYVLIGCSIVGFLPSDTRIGLVTLLLLGAFIGSLMKAPLFGFRSNRRVCAAALLVSFFFWLGYIESAPPKSPEQIAAQQAEKAAAEQDWARTHSAKAKSSMSDENRQELWIIKTEDAMRSRMKDPRSVQFRNVIYKTHEGAPVVCGEVNANNSFGGKIGFQRFVASGDKLMFLEEQVTDFSQAWNIMCTGK